jgi:adenylylsulfate kinase
LHPDIESGFAVWLTGLPASGKSAVTAELTRQLRLAGVRVAVLESDAMRLQFPAPTYDARDREYFYSALAFIGSVLVQSGIHVVFDATANRRSFRDRARLQIGNFLEVYVDTPLEVCMRRDPKGIYRKGKAGELHEVPGLQVEYEPPLHPDLVIHGDLEDPETAANRIIGLLRTRQFLPPL